MTFLLTTLLLLAPPPTSNLLGDWTGHIVLEERSHQVHLTVIESEIGTLGRLAFTDLGRRYIAPVAERDSVRLAVQTVRFGYLEIAATVTDGRLAGIVRGSSRGEIALRRIDAICEMCEAAAGDYVSGTDTLTLTFRPRGGMLMLISGPESLAVGERFPVDDRLVRLDRTGQITEEMRVRRDGTGRVRSLDRLAGDATSTWRRVQDGVRQREIRFRSGDLRLTGTLYEPQRARPVAAVAAIQGSLGGRIASRENFWQLSFARALVRRGIAVLVPDKRGSGSSEGEWTLATVHDLADDAEAAVRSLRELVPVGTRVGLAALSEGGWVAPVVAARSGAVDFVVSVSGSVLDAEENGMYEIGQLGREAGLGDRDVEDVVELQALAAAYARSGERGDWEDYLERRRRLSARPGLSAVVDPFPTDPGHPRLVQFIHRVRFDPLPYWSKVGVPVFAVWGGRDIRVPGALSYERLGRVLEEDAPGKNHELALYEESGHSIEDPETGRLREELMDRLSSWLERTR